MNTGHLFQMVKDKDELEKLYKRAYDESIEATEAL